MRFVPIIILSFVLFSCTSSTENKEIKPDALTIDTISNIYRAPTYYDYKNTSLNADFHDTTNAKFSSDIVEDRFTVFVPKGLVTETKSTIRITNKEGEVIYEHTFPTRELVNGYATVEIKSDAEMEKYILEEAMEVFQNGLVDLNKLSEESYLKQAAKEDFTDHETFMQLKTSGRMLFHYCLQEESHYYLGYSIKQKKTVTIIDCC
jgi:hypothetical protein